MPACGALPVLKGVVHYGFQHQAVADVRWATEMEHVDAAQGRVGIAQAAGWRRETQDRDVEVIFLGGRRVQNVKYGL